MTTTHIERNEALPWRQAAWFAVKFCAFFLAMEYAYFAIPDDFLRDTLYFHVLVAPCVAVINFLNPAEQVLANHSLMTSAKASLEIVRGCDGAGTIFLLMAAVLAFSSPFKTKILGFLVGIFLLMAVNHLRIIGLYFIAAYQNSWFAPIHSYVAPTLIIMIGCVFFAVWSQYALSRHT
ncbi:MAG: hypothetical protein RL497_2568 [Pseudomonadota bacterium]|jgi:exosortase family protein XrtM